MDKSAFLKAAASVVALLLACGCQSTNGLVQKNKDEQLLIDQQVNAAHQHFMAGNYAEAEAILKPLAAEKTVNQPLHLYELSSVYLLSGQKEKAHRTLLQTHESIEGFFDEKSEKSAASLWGSESKKVFKGEPYERGTLYLLLALSFLEQGNVDNALAALKTGLLADSDTEEQTFKADYALLQFLAAKCYDLRNEPDLRDQMLNSCFNSLTGIDAVSAAFAGQLAREYERRAAGDSLVLPPSAVCSRLCVLASEKELTLWLQRHGQPEERAQLIAAWAKQTTADANPMQFNTLVLLWNGIGPDMSRTGEYGEQRVIHPGTLPDKTLCSLMVNRADYDTIGGFGDVSFQATTRGGRVMDDVLGKQAAFKGTMDDSASMLLQMSQQDYGNGAVNLGMMAIAGICKATAAATKVEADIRHWKNLPCQMELLTLNLEPGTHDLIARHWRYATPVAEQEHNLSTAAGAPLTVLHLHPPAVSADQLKAPFSIDPWNHILFIAAKTRAFPVDANSDGELSAAELAQARQRFEARFDSDQDGTLSNYELDSFWRSALARFSDEMVVTTQPQPKTDLVKNEQ